MKEKQTFINYNETIVTDELIEEAIELSEMAPMNLTPTHIRILNYQQLNPDKRLIEGSRITCTCMDPLCVNPEHIKIIPPLDN